MEFKDYYKIMGVSPEASADEIKRAYRILARKYHPDVSKEADAEARFKEVGEAYAVLSDAEKRKAYDNLRKGGYRAGEEFNVPPNWDFRGGAAPEGRYQEANFEDFSDFFSNLFGGGGFGGFRQARRGGAQPHFRSRGEDISYALTISLHEAYHGGQRSLQLEVPQVDATGQIEVKTRTLNVKIPAGVTDKQKIRLKGQGSPGMQGEAGDLYLEIHIAPDPLFHLHNKDLTLALPVAPWEAALGTTVPVPTLDGKLNLKIPANSQTGTKLRLKGKGLPGNPSGDLFVMLQIVIPKADTPQAVQLYEQMAKDLAFNPRHDLEMKL